MAFNIKSKSGRSSLPARREPYWSRVRTGLYVGYRKLKVGEGTWIARRQENGEKQYRALGTITDEGAFDHAVDAAKVWNDSLEQGASNTVVTVEDVCRAYVDHIKVHNSPASAADAEGRFKRLIYGTKIGHIQLPKLKTTDIKKWLNSQVDLGDDDDSDIRRAKDSANRNLNSFKAALNLALDDRLVATDAGWKTVTGFSDVGKRRTGFLDMEQRKALIDACPEDLKLLVKAMLLTAARPGELATLKVVDFNKSQGTLDLEGKTGRRTATLSTVAYQFFMEQSKGKLPSAPLLSREYGDHWNKDAWKKIFQDAVKKARLPTDTVMYTLRHVAISELIMGGMDSFIVARLAGTSVAMIEKHYGHLRHKDNARRKHHRPAWDGPQQQ
jgi:integrase